MSTNGYSLKLRHQPQPKLRTPFKFNSMSQCICQAQLQRVGVTCSSTGDIKATTPPENPTLAWMTTSPAATLHLIFHPYALASSKTTWSWIRIRCCWQVQETKAGTKSEGPLTAPITSFYEGMPIGLKLRSLVGGHSCSKEDGSSIRRQHWTTCGQVGLGDRMVGLGGKHSTCWKQNREKCGNGGRVLSTEKLKKNSVWFHTQ